MGADKRQATIGVDLGTSSVKVTVVSLHGDVLGETSRAYELSHPQPGWSEIDPDAWWDATCACLRELVCALPDVDVMAIGVTGQMHTVVPLDADNRPVRPALMWNDRRTANMVASAREALLRAGATEAAATVSTGSPALNLRWLREVEPESFGAMHRFVIGPDWIVLKLTGVAGTDWCEASTSSLFDLSRGVWSEAACEALGIPTSMLPSFQGSQEVAGGVSARASRETGIAEGVAVVVGTGDNPASAIATGCITDGATVISLGTSGVVMGVRTGDAQGDGRLKGKRILLSLDGTERVTMVQGSVQSCGSTRDWLLKRVLNRSYDQAERDVAQLGSGTGDLLFFPHMSGEKTLFGDASLRGAFVGLDLETGPAELDRALMEGIAYGLRQLSEEMGLADSDDAIRVVGGGSRSDSWLQRLADALGRPMQRLEGETGAGYGAALLARAALRETRPEASQTVRLGKLFLPDDAAVARHNARYQRYLRMREALKQIDTND